MSVKKIIFGMLFVLSTQIYAFNSSVVDMVGIPAGSTSTVVLPSVVSAESSVVPLFQIKISTNSEGYTLTAITCTISDQGSFNASVDLLPLASGGLVLYKDASNFQWEGTGTETLIPVTFSPSAWTGAASQVIKLTLDSAQAVGLNDVYYVCMRTSARIGDGDQFRAELDDAGEVILGISGASDLQPTLAANGTVMTADTIAPTITADFTPDDSDGTTISVSNNASENVYKTGDQIDVNIYIRENGGIGDETDANLQGDTDVVALNDCIEISASSILGSLGYGTTTFTEIGSGIFRVQFTINDSAVNQNTDGTSPLTFGIKVRDGAGNESSLDTSFEIYLDSKTPEAVSLTSPSNGDYANTKTPVFSWTASDEEHLKDYVMVVATSSNFGGQTNNYTIGKSTTSLNLPSGWDGGSTLGALVSGTAYYWTVYASDLAGHAGSLAAANYPAAGNFVYDAQVPETAVFSAPTAGSTLQHGFPTITATVGDYGLSGVDSSEIVMLIKQGAGGTYTPVVHTSVYSAVTGSYTLTYTPATALADGAYGVRIEAQDALGNEMVAATRSFFIDKTLPTITDSDNDGESDEYERANLTDWLDASEPAVSSNQLWPKDGQVINAATLAETAITGAANEIRISIDDPYEDYSGIYNSDVDYDASTVTISGAAGTWVFGVNDLPYAKDVSNNDTGLGLFSSYDTFDCQIPVPLAADGSDDGPYTVTINAEDGAGNTATIVRSFIYDATGPTISTVTAPATAETGSTLSLAITASDLNAISGDADAAKVYYLNSSGVLLSTGNLTADTEVTDRYTHAKSWASGTDGTYYYYFSAEDKAGNVTYCPAGANFDKSKAIQLTITDNSGPWVVIGNETDAGEGPAIGDGKKDSFIKTCVGMNLAGALQTDYNYDNLLATKVDEIPTVYSWTNNKLQATIETEAIGALFQYKVYTSTTWIDVTGGTAETTTDTVWEANWDTTGLTETIYDIRVKAWDVVGNTTTPTSVVSPGWVQVKLEAPLAPVAVIHAAQNDVVVKAGQRIRKRAVLTANLGTTENQDFASVKFEYRAAGGSWTEIATDSISSAVVQNVAFTFDYADLTEYIQARSIAAADVVIDTSQVIGVMFDCATAAYDRQMTFYGSSWTVTVPFVTGASYNYVFKVDYKDGSSDSFRDIDEQDNDGVITNSRIFISQFMAEWDVSGLPDGAYDVRAVAKDSRDITDPEPTVFALTVDNSAPTSVSILSPAENERIDTSAGIELYAQVADTADTENAYVYFMYSMDGGYIWTRIANEALSSSTTWTQNWVAAAMAYDSDISNCLIKAVAVDEAGNFTESAARNVILDATDPEILSFEMNSSSSTEIDLNMGTAYTWTVTTLSPDLDNVEITRANIGVANYRWTPANEVTSWTGSGTVADPYRFSGTVCLNVNVLVDNQQEVFTAILQDKSGRTNAVAVTKNVNYKDVTPNPAAIVAVDGLEVRSGDALVTAGELITVKYRAANTDAGVIYYQYKASASSDWLTFAQDIGVADSTVTVTNTANFPPAGTTLVNGNYDLRVLSIDDDGNADPSPVTVTITVDTSLPIVKPAAITDISATGVISMIEYDELVNAGGSSEINVEYRVQGSTAWVYWAGSGKGAAIGEAGDLWTCDANFAPLSGTYDLRAICVENGGLEQDSSIAPVYTVEVKRDSAGNVVVYRTTSKVMNVTLGNVTIDSTYAGTELTATGTLAIKSDQALTNVTARLMTTDGVTNVDRYLTVSGSGSNYTATIDMSEIMDSVGTVRILVTAIDASGNYVSEDMMIASEADDGAGNVMQPDDINVNVGRINDVDFTNDLENASRLIVYQASTSAVPSTQSSVVTTLVGEPWEFVLSEPEAFQVSNTCAITFTYRDNELMGGDETKLGVVYWDAVNSKWSSEGITNVTRDIVANTVEFRTNHFSKFQLAVINSDPAVSFANPVSGGYADSNPMLELDLSDGFSAIREVKVEVDGQDQTDWLEVEAGGDGIDNDGDGETDEVTYYYDGTVNVAVPEQPFYQSGATSAKYLVKAPMHLASGSHTLKVTVTNEQGISASSSITFTVGAAMDIINAKSYPNQFNPDSTPATLSFTIPEQANVTIKIYDFSGREVFSKNYGSQSGTTEITWNGCDKDMCRLANGVYFAKIEADAGGKKVSKTLKVAILK